MQSKFNKLSIEHLKNKRKLVILGYFMFLLVLLPDLDDWKS